LKVRELSTLVRWLKDNDIHAIEVQEPDMSVRIVMRRRTEATGAIRAEEYAAPPALSKHKSRNVTANAQGIFLLAHPLRTSPLAAAGDMVKAGDVLGLLKVMDVLYQPVLARQKGRLVRALALDGELIEEGMPLFELDIDRSCDLTSLRKKDGTS
jgi:acetyl-CoA carboxylase biotin carboxyl carrier protein